MVDIRSFFASYTSTSTAITSNISSSEAESEEEIEVSPCKAPSSSKPVLPKKCSKSRSTSSTRKYLKIWEEDYPWLHYDADCEGAFCKICKASRKSLYRTGGVWTTKPFTNWKKARDRMRDRVIFTSKQVKQLWLPWEDPLTLFNNFKKWECKRE